MGKEKINARTPTAALYGWVRSIYEVQVLFHNILRGNNIEELLAFGHYFLRFTVFH